MKLSRTVMYALQAACQLGLAGQEAPVPSKKLAESGGMPDRFLLQILRNLVAHGLLRSTRGVIGGYTLARSPDEISLLDIIEAVEGPVTFELAEPGADQACLQQALEAVTSNVRRDLGDLKLSQLLSGLEEKSNGMKGQRRA
jgi:Rrf2 family protein